MRRTLELAGFFAAHAIWCVSDGGPLIPIGAYETADGKRGVNRFVNEEKLERAVAAGKEWNEKNPDGVARSVLIYDGYITLESGRTDALFLELMCWVEPAATLLMAVPYRAHDHAEGFAVFRPKFLSRPEGAPPDYEAWGEAFFQGVDGHEHGSRVWNLSIDQSR